ncbi:protein-tyrosine phosphatase [Georgenia satyanarayanai]|uniref:Protein-tyrosine phosphatase n=2 Tax=Georgenia satyanarayanai TaxID=860221 RepID=A0A2Y9C7Z0_9MICO|nr:protein-tyrosine phosphatase [Georgenia satyanarayanai]SSA47263.1 protein-tyrosine phosphatase [Georgenia satyanarayanai]
MTMAAYRSGEDFTLLIVCTGNICRSPAIERLFRSAFAADSGISVHSAGTGALVGEPIQPPMVALLDQAGVSADGFAARRVTEPMVAGADLVLTATRQHRADVVDHVPAAVRRTFTLREFARLAAAVEPAELDAAAGPGTRPAERLAALVPLAARERAQVPAELDDVVDPYRRSDEVYQESFEQLIEAVRVIARVVLGVGATA